MSYDSLFVIDICGTIFRSNTTFDFIRYWFSETPWYKRMQLIRHFRIVGFLNAKIHKWFHIDIIRKYAISKLKGYTNLQLSKMTTEFYDGYLSMEINEKVIELIEKKRQEGAKLIIISATLDCISKEVAKRLNIEIQYSSEMAYKDGICQGKLKRDLLASKLWMLHSLGLDNFNYEVITDDYSDSDIISKAKHVYLVQYTNKSNKWARYLNENILKRCELIRV